jgi:hypothetical protein
MDTLAPPQAQKADRPAVDEPKEIEHNRVHEPLQHVLELQIGHVQGHFLLIYLIDKMKA